MKFPVELKERNRITIPPVIRQGLALRVGDFLEVNVEVIKRAEKKEAK